MRAGYLVFFHVAIIVSMIALVFAVTILWRRRRMNGANSMIMMVLGLFIWTMGTLLESTGTGMEQQNIFNNISITGTLMVPPAWLIFSVNYTSGVRLIDRWRILPFCIFPVIATIIIWQPDLRLLMWSHEWTVSVNDIAVTSRQNGPFFWLVVAHNYLLIVAGAIVLLKNMIFGVRIYVGQAVSVILAVLIPAIGNFLYIFDLLPIMHFDLTPLLFSLSVIIFMFGVMRFNLFEVVPFAHRQIIQQMKEGILVFDAAGRLLDANPVAMNTLQLTRQDIGRGDTASASLSFFKQNLPEVDAGNVEMELQLAGQTKIFDIESVRMQGGYSRHAGFLVIMRDVTEKKQMQEQMMAQDRLASIGELTSGVAHEINNPLAIIKGLVELTLAGNLTDAMREDLDLVNAEVDRATEIVQNLLTFSRSQTDKKKTVDINELVEKTCEMRVYEAARDNVRIETDLDGDIPNVLGSELKLRQVLINLIINAEYFLGMSRQEGTISVATRKDGGQVKITVSDNGPGINRDDLPRVFDPFFTTKDIGKGTGLGLSICHGIITEHGGEIRVSSTEGVGTTFEIRLPAPG